MVQKAVRNDRIDRCRHEVECAFQPHPCKCHVLGPARVQSSVMSTSSGDINLEGATSKNMSAVSCFNITANFFSSGPNLWLSGEPGGRSELGEGDQIWKKEVLIAREVYSVGVSQYG